MKKSQVHALERVYRRRIPADDVITAELAVYVARLSRDIGRQIGVLIDRRGEVAHVVCGDENGIVIPDLLAHGLGRGKLRGVRCVHTHLRQEPLSEDDLADLMLLRLDAMVALGVTEDGRPGTLRLAHLLPPNPEGEAYRLLPPADFYAFRLAFGSFVEALEEETAAKQVRARAVRAGQDRAILISVSAQAPRHELEDRMNELRELARTASIEVLDEVVQRPRHVNPRYLLGQGKIREVIAAALQRGADLLIFDQELTPGQVRAISEITDVRVIDRTQLILDIFARRAHTPDGKLQVELAQLKYILPRLVGKGTAMSRLMGGIGGRGPGESKLETDRRRVRDRISHLERRLEAAAKRRIQRRSLRVRSGIPIASIVGYTNAGKSTLLNALTQSDVFTEDLLFATLDTASRRLRFPREREVIVTDTVGFLRDLPSGLLGAFRATLEELRDADLLLHVVDVANPAREDQIAAVEKVLRELDLGEKPVLRLFNKIDLLPPGEARSIAGRLGGLPLSARDRATFGPLLDALERRFWPEEIREPELPLKDGAVAAEGYERSGGEANPGTGEARR
ncbi:MAG: GTPase HflX [Deltaproteobacteria bacterium]|nr:GTPase HflX [Deltaproteobacteria bacterium]